MKKTFSKNKPGEILEFINEEIKKHKLKKSEENRASLMAEETLMALVDHTSDDEITVTTSYIGGTLKIKYFSRGEAFNPLAADDLDPMREALMRSFAEDIESKNHKNTNIITITAYKSRYLLLYKLVAGGLAGVLLSLILKVAAPASTCQWVATNIMDLGQNLFMNCLNMLIPLLVFFSIASAIVGFGNASELGRIGGKLMGIYMATTIFATIFGFSMVELIKPYNIGSLTLEGLVSEESAVGLSFRDSILALIPDNFVKSFLEGDTVQIIFLAAFIGVTVGALGNKAKPIQDLINAGNEVFLKMTNSLVSFIPALIFCIASKTILSGGSGEGSVINKPILIGIGVYLATVVVMIIFYLLVLRVLGGLKPSVFVKKYLPYMPTIIGTGSSSALIPLNMKVCSDLGVDKKVYALSIPLGATVNMDGTTIYMAVFGLIIARLYGLPINIPVLLTMAFAITMLSAGAPPVMGSSIICLSALLRTLGLPVAEAVSMVLGIEVIAGLVRTANNAVCDMVGSLVVAKQEGLLNKEKYYSKN